ncbi:MAG TPA: hypothetical protein VIY86_06960, partial [Pirellulaceae bacterium]
DGRFLISSSAAVTVPGATGTDSDVFEFQPAVLGTTTVGTWQLYFDAAAFGLTTAAEDIDAFSILEDGSIVVSTLGGFSVPGPGGNIVGNDEDLLRFIPTRTGPATLGAWEFYFDGSDVGLTEDLDALEVLPDGRFLISSSAAVTVPGATGTDSDVFEFQPAVLGTTTVGTWQLYFDAAAFGLTTAAEDIDALAVGPTGPSSPHYFSTSGAFSVAGATGGKGDVFRFDATGAGAPINGAFMPGLSLTATLLGLGTKNVDGLELAVTSPLFVSVLGQGTAEREITSPTDDASDQEAILDLVALSVPASETTLDSITRQALLVASIPGVLEPWDALATREPARFASHWYGRIGQDTRKSVMDGNTMGQVRGSIKSQHGWIKELTCDP